jgi:hypothetical protein
MWLKHEPVRSRLILIFGNNGLYQLVRFFEVSAMRNPAKLLLLLMVILTACQNEAEPTEITAQPNIAEVVLPDEHLILTAPPTPMPTNTPETASTPRITPTPISPPLYHVQDGILLVRDGDSDHYTPDPAFPPELQGQVASVRSFTNAAGLHWLVYDENDAAVAGLFPDEDGAWTNLLAAGEAEMVFHPNWDRELIDFGDRDLVIVDETSGIADFEFLFVHSEWMPQQAVVDNYRVVDAAQINKALNYLRVTAANQGFVAITPEGLEIVASRLPSGWKLAFDEQGELVLLDRDGEIATVENPSDYLLFREIFIVVSTKLPANRIDMFRNIVVQSATRHFWHGGRLTVHIYLPEEKLRQFYLGDDNAGTDWQLPLIGLSEAGVILVHSRDLLDQIQRPASRGWSDATVLWMAGEPLTNIAQLFNLITDLPPGVTLTQNTHPEYFDYLALLGESEEYPLRFRIHFAEE